MKRLLVIKLSALGDFFIATSAFEAIRHHHPHDHITLLTTAPYLEIAGRLGYFDQVWADERPSLTHFKKIWALRKRLQAGNFDRVYDLQMVDRTNFYYQLTRTGLGKKTEWVGAAWGATHPYSLSKVPLYHQERLKGLLHASGIDALPPLNVTRLAGDMRSFNINSPFVVFAPGASRAHRERKCWPPEKYATVAKAMVQAGFTPVIIGGGDEDNHLITEICPESIDLTGKTNISDIVTLTTHAAFAIGNDTGPMHIAAACQCPVLTLFFGDADPAAGGPRGIFYRHMQATHKRALDVGEVLKVLPEFIQKYKASGKGKL